MTADPPKNILAGKSSHRDIQQRRGTQQPYASRPATAPPPPAPCLARKAAPRCRHCLAAATPLARRDPGLARRRWHPGPGQAAPPHLIRRRRCPSSDGGGAFCQAAAPSPRFCQAAAPRLSPGAAFKVHMTAAPRAIARLRRRPSPGAGATPYLAATARFIRRQHASPGNGAPRRAAARPRPVAASRAPQG